MSFTGKISDVIVTKCNFSSVKIYNYSFSTYYKV